MLDIAVRANDTSGIQVITLTGEFGLADQERVESLRSEIFTDKMKGIVFDLTAVSYMEEAGYATLTFYLQEAIRIGVFMAIVVQPKSILAKKINRMGLVDVGLKVFNSQAEAERALNDTWRK